MLTPRVLATKSVGWGWSQDLVIVSHPSWPAPILCPVIPTPDEKGLPWTVYAEMPKWVNLSCYALEAQCHTVEYAEKVVREWVDYAEVRNNDG